ncbi:hypothetical protein BJ165DRAFT_914956 [Panaeolus papilionaceus]|nr:hypothetical protein BJ165DRAFT_914956 [Panaeolus papilionaceus]
MTRTSGLCSSEFADTQEICSQLPEVSFEIKGPRNFDSPTSFLSLFSLSLLVFIMSGRDPLSLPLAVLIASTSPEISYTGGWVATPPTRQFLDLNSFNELPFSDTLFKAPIGQSSLTYTFTGWSLLLLALHASKSAERSLTLRLNLPHGISSAMCHPGAQQLRPKHSAWRAMSRATGLSVKFAICLLPPPTLCPSESTLQVALRCTSIGLSWFQQIPPTWQVLWSMSNIGII